MADKIFTFRIPEELLDKLRVEADKEKRSIAKHVEYILEQWYEPSKSVEVSPAMEKAIKNLLQVFKDQGALPPNFF